MSDTRRRDLPMAARSLVITWYDRERGDPRQKATVPWMVAQLADCLAELDGGSFTTAHGDHWDWDAIADYALDAYGRQAAGEEGGR